MAADFPASPVTGTTYTVGGRSWYYDGTVFVPVGARGGLTYLAQTVTTADVTGAANYHYSCTIAGLTADRNFTFPSGATAGDRIVVSIVDGDSDYALILKGATGVTINGGTAATEWSRLYIANESVEFTATSSNNWQVTRDDLQRNPLDAREHSLVERLVLRDTFTDTNGTLLSAHTPDVYPAGASWAQTYTGTTQIQSNVARGVSGDGMYGIDVGVTDLRIKFEAKRSGVYWLVGWRGTGSNINGYYLYADASSFNFGWNSTILVSLHGYYPPPSTSGFDRFEILHVDDNVRVWHNGLLILNYIEPTAQFNDTDFRLQLGAAAEIDNLEVYSASER